MPDSTYDYYHELERSERRGKYFRDQYGGCCFTSVLILVMFICSPCICYDKFNKVTPEKID